MFSRLFPAAAGILALASLAWGEAVSPSTPPAPPTDPGVPRVSLPTGNDWLYKNRPEQFYMYVNRTVDGVPSKPWEGGAFGLVRTPVLVNGKLVCRKFHEGVDIIPMERDAAGRPLDPVGAIADGTVVHVSNVAGLSNYGKYVVVEHPWDGSKVYSLYAHLSEASCVPGQSVKLGDKLGTLGFTGAGIDRTRAHLHLEIGLVLSPRYEGWHTATAKGVNRHGIYNGMNLAGADPAAFFTARRANPNLRFSDYVKSVPAYFKVAVPASPHFDFPARYPWLLAGGSPAGNPPSWEISFSATGLPVRIAPSDRKVDAPVVVQVRPSDIPHRFLTRYLLNGEDRSATLSKGGAELVALVTGNFPDAPVKPEPAAARK